jgi:DUF4097 and DUF4098 domain-containing protein YvlB
MQRSTILAASILAALFLVSLTTTAPAALAAEPFHEKLTVPLTDPARPAHVEIALVMGGVTVVGGAVEEVTIEASARVEEDEGEVDAEDERPERRGMRRIPNTALGLEAEEKDNRVEITSDSWRQPVDLKITVPLASTLVVSTVNDGELAVDGVEGELELHNTNGGISVKGAKGPVSASTVNGDVRVEFRSGTAPAAPMAFSTLNGDIEVTLPAGLKADVRMRSDNGEIYSDFDVALDRKPAKVEEQREKGRYRVVLTREVAGKIGGGGPELLLKTFNGDIVLKRAGS